MHDAFTALTDCTARHVQLAGVPARVLAAGRCPGLRSPNKKERLVGWLVGWLDGWLEGWSEGGVKTGQGRGKVTGLNRIHPNKRPEI